MRRSASGRRVASISSSPRSPFWVTCYYLSLAPLVVSQGTNVAYVLLDLSWKQAGLRARHLESYVDPSPGWPPFHVPGLVFVAMAVVIAAMAIEMVVRRSATPSGSQPGFMAFSWALVGVLCYLQSSAFDDGLPWTEPEGLSGLVMIGAGGVALVVFVQRGLERWRTSRAGSSAADHPALVLDPVRVRMLRGARGKR